MPHVVLDTFIQAERERFETKYNNIFGFAFGKIATRRAYLDVILARYKAACARFVDNTRLLHAGPSEGTRELTADEMALLEAGGEIQTELHLDIESFYLFAKILLDNVAHALEFYFGAVRGVALDSHDNWVKNANAYTAGKGLTPVPESLLVLATELKTSVSDYRDYQISHEKSPRTMKGTVFSLDGSDLRIMSTRLYPRETDGPQVESEPPVKAIVKIDNYLDQVVQYLAANRERTSLPLAL